MTPDEYKIWYQGYIEGLKNRRIVVKQIFEDLEKVVQYSTERFIQELKKKYLGDD